MLAFGCQPIVEEPDAGPPVNHPPRIDDRFSSPQATLIAVDLATDNCTTPLYFSAGEVIDEDIDQTVQERWLVDYDPKTTTDLGTTITLQPLHDSPSIRTDSEKAFTLQASTLDQSRPHTIDVLVSDGFDTVGPPDGGPLRPNYVQANRDLVRKTWVIWFSTPGACPVTPNTP